MNLEEDILISEFRPEIRTNQAYLDWNIAQTVKKLMNNPGRYAVALNAYEFHKKILRSIGVSEEFLLEGDKIVERAKKEHVKYN